MLAGELYRACDPELSQMHLRAQRILERFNRAGVDDDRESFLRELLGHFGEGAVLKPTLRCDYGCHIHFGAGSFAN